MQQRVRLSLRLSVLSRVSTIRSQWIRSKSPKMACCSAVQQDEVAAFEQNEQQQVVQDYYGKELLGTEDLKVRALPV